MAQNPPYMPAKDSLLGPWSDTFSTTLTAAPTDYGLVAGDAVAVAAVVTPWLAALGVATTPATRTPVSIAAKDDARAAMEVVVRPYAVQISQNPSVSNELKTTIGVTPRITTRTRNSVVAAPITSDFGFLIAGSVEFRATNPDTPLSKARPLGALGWEIQIQHDKGEDPPDWVTVLDLVVTRPIFPWPPDGNAAFGWRYRVRWVGAVLAGGALNVGPWSEWITFSFPGA